MAFSYRNWARKTQAVPQRLISEPNYGSYIVDEEIPPHWVEIPQYLQVAGNDRVT
jgi:hypothetical protein